MLILTVRGNSASVDVDSIVAEEIGLGGITGSTCINGCDGNVLDEDIDGNVVDEDICDDVDGVDGVCVDGVCVDGVCVDNVCDDDDAAA